MVYHGLPRIVILPIQGVDAKAVARRLSFGVC